MQFSLDLVAKGNAELALRPTSLEVASGRVTVVGVTTQQGPTVLSLIAAGRMRPGSGHIECVTRTGAVLDGRAARRYLRLHTALIDTPRVCEPDETMTVRDITAEELTFAGRRSNALTANHTLEELGLRHLAARPIGLVAPDERVRLLTELALRREGIEGIVLTTPDRHGGDDAEWATYAAELASRGLAVLVITGVAAARHTAATDRAAAALAGR